MAFLYPWGNTQQLNLDWIIQKIKELENAPLGSAEVTAIANALLAATYSAGSAYDVGDIVYRNQKLYVCNTAITSPGETWDPSHWDEVLLGDAVAGLIQKTDGDIVQDVRYHNHKIQQKKAGNYADVIPVEDTPSNNSDRLASSKAAYDLKDAITSKLFTKTVTFSTSAITSTNPISDSKFTANTRLIGYQFINSSNQETGDILADLTTNTAAGSCTVILNKGYAAGSVILTFGNPT